MSVKFSLIICTYKRAESLNRLLISLKTQIVYPSEILIIDGSPDNKTKDLIKNDQIKSLKYYHVAEENRGLTKQRNFGIELVDENSEIICFLDDDIVLEENYFGALISTYNTHRDAMAVGGYIVNETKWTKGNNCDNKLFCYDGWKRLEPLRFRVRKWFGLLPDKTPGFLPTFSHGRSIGFLPPSGKIYRVEQIMGGVSSYRRTVFDKLKFSNYFQGYGLYEDADFSLRLAKLGKLFINTNARLYHYHDDSGRPNKFKYGKMVIRNGWYVWRVKYPKPDFKTRIKWNATALLLTILRFLNIFNTRKRQEAFTESIGRVVGWFSLIFNKPILER